MTKFDKSRQLSVEQERAIGLLLTWASDREVAEVVGVTRQTVNTRRSHDDVFIATLNRRRAELWEETMDGLRRLVRDAVEALADELRGDDKQLRHQAAVAVLRAAGLPDTRLLRPTGPIDPQRVAAVRASREELSALLADLAWAGRDDHRAATVGEGAPSGP